MSDAHAFTLPDWLRHQAQQRPHAVALRHKRLGEWRALSWHEVQSSVARLADGLVQRGFVPGDVLLLVSQPREEAVLLSLAAQWTGGVAIPLDPHTGDDALRAILAQLAPRFAFADDDTQLDRLLTHEGLRVIDANPRALPPHPHPAVTDYRALAQATQADAGSAPKARADDDAFAFVRLDGATGQLVAQRFTHANLVREAGHLVRTEQLDASDEAFAARAFAAASQARYLIAPWLMSGFRLNFPESLATRDNDRRDLAPTLVAGTRETYARVAQLVSDRLPGARSLRRRLLECARCRQGGLLVRTLTWWLIARPLREVIGFSRTRAALVIGPPLDEATAALFTTLRVEVRAWPDSVEWRPLAAMRESVLSPRYNADGAAQQPAF